MKGKWYERWLRGRARCRAACGVVAVGFVSLLGGCESAKSVMSGGEPARTVAAAEWDVAGGASVGATETGGAVTRSEFGVRIVQDPQGVLPVQRRRYRIEGLPARREALVKYDRLLREELALYPRSFFEATRAKRVVLCRSLLLNGQVRTALPDLADGTLYVDVEAGAHDEAYQRRVIHHELFHMVDYRQRGWGGADRAWSDLNPAGFRYGAGGGAAQADPTVGLADERLEGFVNRYSMAGAEEDKAEVYAFLVVHPSEMAARTARDEVLAGKARLIRQRLITHSLEMDGRFWQRAEAVRSGRPE